jgi:hypothetical protein
MLTDPRGALLVGILGVSACSDVFVVPPERDDDTSNVGGTNATTTASGAGGAGASGGNGGGAVGGGHGGGAVGGGGPPGQAPGVVGVGYGNLRIVSRDDGVTWSSRVVEGAPDDLLNLLWSVAWGSGRWVAVGRRLLISDDGVTWTDETPSMPCAISEGVAFFQGQFWMGCLMSPGAVLVRSDDGLEWSDPVELDGNFQTHVFLFSHGGKLVAHDGIGSAVQSTDGLDWSPLDLDWPAFCDGAWQEAETCGPDMSGSSWHDGTWLAASWPGTIRRSIDGETYSDSYVDPEGYSVFDGRGFVRGWVAPE